MLSNGSDEVLHRSAMIGVVRLRWTPWIWTLPHSVHCEMSLRCVPLSFSRVHWNFILWELFQEVEIARVFHFFNANQEEAGGCLLLNLAHDAKEGYEAAC